MYSTIIECSSLAIFFVNDIALAKVHMFSGSTRFVDLADQHLAVSSCSFQYLCQESLSSNKRADPGMFFGPAFIGESERVEVRKCCLHTCFSAIFMNAITNRHKHLGQHKMWKSQAPRLHNVQYTYILVFHWECAKEMMSRV